MAKNTPKSKKQKMSFNEWLGYVFYPNAEQKAQKKAIRAQRKKARKGKPVWVRILGGFFRAIFGTMLVGFLTTTLVVGALVIFWVSNFDAEANCPDLSALSQSKRSIIWVQDENEQWVPYHNLEGGNSVWVGLEDIPVDMQNAVIAIEDERFRDHEGVDWKRTAGAMVNLVANRAFNLGSTEYGGSTITQQLIKVTTKQNDHSVKRKVNEILTAYYMESNKYTKDEILEGYLNNVPLTGDLVGVGIGARQYFGKEIDELSLAECAVLASITNNPSLYNPYTHPENVRQRQQLVLAKMYEVGFITKDEYVQALNEELIYQSSAVKQEVQDYYVDLVIEDVIADLMEQYDYTYSYAQNLVYYGGLNIYSAENPEIQAKIQAVYADESNFPAHIEGDEEEPQAAFFCVDYDGKVIATVGGRGEKTENRVLNRSTASMRSPGSSIKPLSTYSMAIQNNVVHYSSVLRDAPITLPNGKLWPKNYGQSKAKDSGDVLLGVALQKSLNTTVVRLVDEMGKENSFDYLQDTYHLSTLVTNKVVEGNTLTDKDLAPLSLGAFSDGVTAREMAAAYAVFGNGGYYNEPYTYYYVTRSADGDNAPHMLDKGNLERGGCNTEVALSNSNNSLESAQNAYIMNRLLQRVTENRSGSTGWLYLGQDWKDWQVYGKTGTSEDDKDVYFCGGTTYYCASSWFGYDGNQELSTKTNPRQTYYAKILWSKAMKVLHEDLQIKDFEAPAGIEELTYCTKTGLIANGNCKSTDVGVYKTDFKPDVCTCGGTQTTQPDKSPSGGTTTGNNNTTGTTTGTGTTNGADNTDGTENTDSIDTPTPPVTDNPAALPTDPEETTTP